MISNNEVIRYRQNEIINEVRDMEEEMQVLQTRLHSLSEKRDMRMAEYDLLENVGDRNVLVSSKLGSKPDKMGFEDCLRSIFDSYGRPMKVGEILRQLEKYNYIFNSYPNAHRVVTTSEHLEKVARGYFQYRRRF